MGNPHKEYVLLHMHARSFPLRNGEPILHVGPELPDLPPGFARSAGYTWGGMHVEVDRNHKGPPRYEWRDGNKAEITKIISGKDSQ